MSPDGNDLPVCPIHLAPLFLTMILDLIKETCDVRPQGPKSTPKIWLQCWWTAPKNSRIPDAVMDGMLSDCTNKIFVLAVNEGRRIEVLVEMSTTLCYYNSKSPGKLEILFDTGCKPSTRL